MFRYYCDMCGRVLHEKMNRIDITEVKVPKCETSIDVEYISGVSTCTTVSAKKTIRQFIICNSCKNEIVRRCEPPEEIQFSDCVHCMYMQYDGPENKYLCNITNKYIHIEGTQRHPDWCPQEQNKGGN